MRRLVQTVLVPLLLTLMVLSLAACQRVGNARAEFCQSLREVGAQAVELKGVKVDQPVDQLRTKVENLQEVKKNLDRLAKLTPIPGLDKLDSALDGVTQGLAQASGNSLGSAAASINAAGDQLLQTYNEVNDAVCAAK